MHQIEIGNEDTKYVFKIERATRQNLQISFENMIESIVTKDYVLFARALTKAYHRLEGNAVLNNEDGKPVLSLTFHRGQVKVEIYFGKVRKTFITDQSYITKTVEQIGIVE